jgi:hypothetical protein
MSTGGRYIVPPGAGAHMSPNERKDAVARR